MPIKLNLDKNKTDSINKIEERAKEPSLRKVGPHISKDLRGSYHYHLLFLFLSMVILVFLATKLHKIKLCWLVFLI